MSGAFAPHPTGSLASLGIWQARASFTLPNVGDLFYGRTTDLGVDADWSILDQNSVGNTTFVPGGSTADLLLGRAATQTPAFNLVVDAVFGSSPSISSFSAVVSNQPIADAIITQSMRTSGYTVDVTLAQLRTTLGLSATADGTAIATALDTTTPTVTPVPVPAAGWLLLAGLGLLGAFKQRYV